MASRKSDAEAAEFRARIEAIEAVRAEGDDDDVAAVYRSWGFLDEAHYEWIRERLIPGYAQRGAMQQTLDHQRAALKEQVQGRAAGMSAELAPVHGVSMEDWAGGNARLAQGGDLAQVLAVLGVDEPTWQAVSAEWNRRMSADATATIATVYGQAFMGAGVGRFAAAGQQAASSLLDSGASDVAGGEPIPFARWIEITEAQSAGVARGEDAADILAGFGMTPAEWGVVGGWWSQRFAAEAMTRLEEYNQLSARYREQYSGRA